MSGSRYSGTGVPEKYLTPPNTRFPLFVSGGFRVRDLRHVVGDSGSPYFPFRHQWSRRTLNNDHPHGTVSGTGSHRPMMVTVRGKRFNLLLDCYWRGYRGRTEGDQTVVDGNRLELTFGIPFSRGHDVSYLESEDQSLSLRLPTCHLTLPVHLRCVTWTTGPRT